ncbi:MAG: metallophosphoesterase family protein, partial [Chthoniobacteraceae bacterium]
MNTLRGLAVIWLGGALGSAPAASLTRGPYLQNGTPTEITIRWRTDVPTASYVTFGPSPASQPDLVFSEVETTEHEFTLTALTPGTQYFYAIDDGITALAGGDAAHTFRTAPLSGVAAPVRVWVIGDSGTAAFGSTAPAAVRDAYLNSPILAHNDVWLMLGDNAYGSGTDEEYQLAVFDIYPAFLRQTVLWSTLGNHETYADPDHPPYFDIFTLPRQAEAGGVASGTEHYYAFDYANVHFVCLDSMQSARAPGSPMLQWLADDLASTEQRWIIAFWHHPPYSKGSHDSDFETQLVEMRENVLPILEAGGVDLVLSGHSHAYERSHFIDGHYGPSSTLVPGMVKDGGDGREDGTGAYGKDSVLHAGAVYVVAGSSGQVSGGALNHPVMFTSLSQLGSLVLDVNGDRLDA